MVPDYSIPHDRIPVVFLPWCNWRCESVTPEPLNWHSLLDLVVPEFFSHMTPDSTGFFALGRLALEICDTAASHVALSILGLAVPDYSISHDFGFDRNSCSGLSGIENQ